MSKVPKVFISYASQDGTWKRHFCRFLKLGLSDFEPIDYEFGGDAAFGPIKAWLKKAIDEADVVIALVSGEYIQKSYPLEEWANALRNMQERESLIFVPVMMDRAAKGWWKNLKELGALGPLGDDYAYFKAFDDDDRKLKLVNDDGPIPSQEDLIKGLGKAIKSRVEHS